MQINNLKAYLANIGMTLKDFCESIDCNHTYMSAVINGRARPGRRLAKDVSEATDGVVHLPSRLRKRRQKQDECQNQSDEPTQIRIVETIHHRR